MEPLEQRQPDRTSLRRWWLLASVALVVAVVGVAVWLLGAERPCSCAEFETAVGAIRTLAEDDWQDIGWESFAQTWPGVTALPCEHLEGSPFDIMADIARRCCDSCGTCGGPTYVPENAEAGTLSAVFVLVCRSSFEEAVADLRMLVDAVVPDEPEAAVGGDAWTWESDAHSYKWRTKTGAMVLRTHVAQHDDRSVGFFDLWRCEPMRPAKIAEVWEIGAGSVVEVIEVEPVRDDNGGTRLSFSYWSECLAGDPECQRVELRSLWPRLERLADSHGARSIDVLRRGCTVFQGWSVGHDKEGRWDLDELY